MPIQTNEFVPAIAIGSLATMLTMSVGLEFVVAARIVMFTGAEVRERLIPVKILVLLATAVSA
jgi:hypothetical protein